MMDAPALRSASAIALGYLDDAVGAAARLRGKADPDALHDFRVAIRRLRVTVRSYPNLKDSVPKKQRGRLRRLARATNRARDAEVQIAWFNDHAPGFTAEQRAAVARVRARLRAHHRTELARIRARLDGSFTKLEHKLRRRLVALRDAPRAGRTTPFRAVVAATLVRSAADLDSRLRAIARGAPTSPRAMHAARIAAKRLRYTLEPVANQVLDGTGLIARLKQLQDRFGALTDAHELDEVLRADQAAGPALQELLEGETAESAAALQAHLNESGGFHKQIAAAVRPLRPPRSGAALLRNLPSRRSLGTAARP
jgi:CHAD domain-containing protein